jgi:hypothetical protein
LIDVAFIESQQHEIALVRDRRSADVTDRKRHSLQQQTAILQTHITTVVVIVPRSRMRLNFLDQPEIGDAHAP